MRVPSLMISRPKQSLRGPRSSKTNLVGFASFMDWMNVVDGSIVGAECNQVIHINH